MAAPSQLMYMVNNDKVWTRSQVCWVCVFSPLHDHLQLVHLVLFPPPTAEEDEDGMITHIEPDILECMVKWALGMCCSVIVVQSWPTLCDSMDSRPPVFSVLGDSPGKNTGVGNHPFSKASSWPRDWTRVSCTTGRLFTVWATRETPKLFAKIT